MTEIALQELPAYLEAGYQIYDIRPKQATQLGSIAQSIYLPIQSESALFQALIPDPYHAILCSQADTPIPTTLQKIALYSCTLPTDDILPSFLPTDLLLLVDEEEFILDMKHDKQAIILDVRDVHAFNALHIRSSISIPLLQLEDSSEDIQAMDKVYIVGTTAEESLCAASILRRLGLINIRAVDLASNEWTSVGIPVVTPSQNEKKPKHS
jgi:rhodanese-related sulfurtransferase